MTAMNPVTTSDETGRSGQEDWIRAPCTRYDELARALSLSIYIALDLAHVGSDCLTPGQGVSNPALTAATRPMQWRTSHGGLGIRLHSA
jgi:hypothetical protein